MIFWKHIYSDKAEEVTAVAQSTSELATHAISRLFGDGDDIGLGLSARDHSLPRSAEIARLKHYLYNSAAESGHPPNPDVVEWLDGGMRLANG